MGNGYVWYQRRNEETGLENQCWKDSWDSISYRDGRLPGFPRATCELQGYAYDAKVRGARLARVIWKDPGVRRRARAAGGRPQAALQPRLLGRGRRVLRPRARPGGQPGRLADLEQRPSALERHRRQVQGEGGRAAPDGAEALLRLGRAHAGRGRGALQPDRLPRRHGLAVRQLVHRLGPAALRLQGGGRADRRRHPRRRGVLRRAPAGGVRRLRAGRRPSTRCSTRRRAAPRPGRPGRRCSCCARCSGLEPLGEHLVVDPALPEQHRAARAARHSRALGSSRCFRARRGACSRRARPRRQGRPAV